MRTLWIGNTRGQPTIFPVDRIIKAWTEALQLMPVGSNWQLLVPSDLAYGERAASAQIGPNATLVFEVDFLSIQPKPTEPKATEPRRSLLPPNQTDAESLSNSQ